MAPIGQQLRHAARSLLRRPGLTVPIVVVLALGLGAHTTIFSVLYGVLLEPLPFRAPDRLLAIGSRHAERGLEEQVSHPDLLELRERTDVFSDVVAFGPWGLTLTASDDPERVPTLIATADFFTALGVEAALGRTFGPDEGTPGRDRVVVLSHALWQRRFGGDPAVVGRTLELDGEPHTVLGVLGPELAFPTPHVGFWKPLVAEDDPGARFARWLHVLGRRAPGVSPAAAREQLGALAVALAEVHPDSHEGWTFTAEPLHDLLVREVRPAVVFLQLAAVLMLVLACVNVASLLLAWAQGSSDEFRMRIALGARPRSLLAQLLGRSFLLCLAAGVLGTALAWGLLQWLRRLLPRSLEAGDFSEIGGHALPRVDQASLDGGVALATAGVLLATTVLFGLVPLLQLRRAAGPRSSAPAAGGRRRSGVRRLLVVAQVALALALLVAAGLLLRSLAMTLRSSPGFTAEGVLTLQASVGQVRDPVQRSQVLQRMLDEVRALPEVEAVGLDTALPFTDVDVETPLLLVDPPASSPEVEPAARLHTVDPGLYRTLRIPLRAGRPFDGRDVAGRPLVMIVNETFARRYFPGGEAVGRRVAFPGAEAHPFEVVGVVGDTRQTGLDAEIAPEVFTVLAQNPPRFATFAVRTTGDPRRLEAVVKSRLREVVPGLAVRNVVPLQELIDESSTERRLVAFLAALFAATALVLASASVYGMVCNLVAERRQEIGVRVALGAERRTILRQLLAEGLQLGVAGIAVGLLAAAAITRTMDHLLFEVDTVDPPTFVVVTATLLLVVVAATLPAAYRALRFDPAVILHRE